MSRSYVPLFGGSNAPDDNELWLRATAARLKVRRHVADKNGGVGGKRKGKPAAIGQDTRDPMDSMDPMETRAAR
jgi:hypothetical protein